MRRLLLVASVWMITTLPCQAAIILELGTNPHMSVHFEGERASLGVGLSVLYDEQDFPDFIVNQYHSLWIFSPTVAARLFLNGGGGPRMFLEARAVKGVPVFTGEEPVNDTVSEYYDDWTAYLGAGFRTEIHERVRLGGSVDARVNFRTPPGYEDTIQGGTTFRVFLDYVLGL